MYWSISCKFHLRLQVRWRSRAIRIRGVLRWEWVTDEELAFHIRQLGQRVFIQSHLFRPKFPQPLRCCCYLHRQPSQASRNWQQLPFSFHSLPSSDWHWACLIYILLSSCLQFHNSGQSKKELQAGACPNHHIWLMSCSHSVFILHLVSTEEEGSMHQFTM